MTASEQNCTCRRCMYADHCAFIRLSLNEDQQHVAHVDIRLHEHLKRRDFNTDIGYKLTGWKRQVAGSRPALHKVTSTASGQSMKDVSMLT